MDQILENGRETLYPRLLLYQKLAEFKGEHERRRPSSEAISQASEAQRDFLDKFANLCDIERGGKTVTAAALQKLERSNILWLAANEGVREPVKKYAEDILDKLIRITTNPETENELRDEIFQMGVEKCAPRLRSYNKDLRTYARNCRMKLRKELPDDSGKTPLSLQQIELLLNFVSETSPDKTQEAFRATNKLGPQSHC